MMTSTVPEPWLDAKATALVLGVHVDDLYLLVRAGVVPARRLGKRLRFVPSELAEVGRFDPLPLPARPAAPAVTAPAPAPVPDTPEVVPAQRWARPAGRQTARQRLAALDPYADLKATG